MEEVGLASRHDDPPGPLGPQVPASGRNGAGRECHVCAVAHLFPFENALYLQSRQLEACPSLHRTGDREPAPLPTNLETFCGRTDGSGRLGPRTCYLCQDYPLFEYRGRVMLAFGSQNMTGPASPVRTSSIDRREPAGTLNGPCRLLKGCLSPHICELLGFVMIDWW